MRPKSKKKRLVREKKARRDTSVPADYDDDRQRKVMILEARIEALITGDKEGVRPCVLVFGSCGGGKSHVVRKKLDALISEGKLESFVYKQATHFSPVSFFEFLAEHNASVIVLDDLLAIWADKQMRAMLQSALDTGCGRSISWEVHGKKLTVAFTGKIIGIVNVPIGCDPIGDALNDRVTAVHFEPSEESLISLIRRVAADSYGGITSQVCQEIADYVIAETGRLQTRLTLRSFFDHAVPDYRAWHARKTRGVHWTVLTTDKIEADLARTYPKNLVIRTKPGPTPPERRNTLEQVVQELAASGMSVKEQAREFGRRSLGSRATFHNWRRTLGLCKPK